MTPASARATLLSQHAGLREHLATCIALAARFVAGEPECTELEERLTALRRELEVHNDTETALIHVLLVGSSLRGEQLVARMVEEHFAEHVMLWNYLTAAIDDSAPKLAAFGEELEAHMAAEERTFLAPKVLESVAKTS